MKGQTSLELLVTVGVVLAFTVPVVFLLLSVTSLGYEDTAKAQADASARSLSDTMNMVYAQGDGAQREVLLNVPANTEEISAADGEVLVRIKTSGGEFDAAAPTIAKISPATAPIGKKSGLLTLCLKNTNGEVELIDSSCKTP
jgi:uncharacterized protein (UPF0333 family)